MTPPDPAAGWQAPRCECGHTEGDHRCAVTPRRVIVGVCLMAGCGCRKFVEPAERGMVA